MYFMSIAWRIFVNLVTGAVILALFHFTNSRFETIVVSTLVLIYAAVIGSYMSLGYALSRKWDIDLARYIAIAKALRLNTEMRRKPRRRTKRRKERAKRFFGSPLASTRFLG